MRFKRGALRAGLLLGALAAMLAIPGSASADGTVEVELNEFNVIPDITSVEGGEVTFNLNNTGDFPHNLRVIRTDLAPDALPATEGEADESQLDVVASSADMNGGESLTLTANLSPGNYVLICNIKAPGFDGHYGAGMYVGFQVTGDGPSAPAVGSAGLGLEEDGSGLSSTMLGVMLAGGVVALGALGFAGRSAYRRTRA